VDWTDPTGDVESGVSGFTNALDSTWTQVDNECAASCRFYCFEQ
jgi:hypothetical protein